MADEPDNKTAVCSFESPAADEAVFRKVAADLLTGPLLGGYSFATYEDLRNEACLVEADLTSDRIVAVFCGKDAGERPLSQAVPGGTYQAALTDIVQTKVAPLYRSHILEVLSRTHLLERLAKGESTGFLEYQHLANLVPAWGYMAYKLDYAADGNVHAWFIATDVSISRRHRLEHAAIKEHDQVTGLWNRETTDILISEYLRQFETDVATLAVLSLNNLDVYSFMHGKKAAEEAVRKAGATIWETFGPLGIVGRSGANEFTVLAEKTRGADAKTLLARLCASMNEHADEKENSCQPTMTAGYAVYPLNAHKAKALYARAGEALALARKQNIPVASFDVDACKDLPGAPVDLADMTAGLPGGFMVCSEDKERILFADPGLVGLTGAASQQDFLSWTGGFAASLFTEDSMDWLRHDLPVFCEARKSGYNYERLEIRTRAGHIRQVAAFGRIVRRAGQGDQICLFLASRKALARIIHEFDAPAPAESSQDSLTGLLTKDAFFFFCRRMLLNDPDAAAREHAIVFFDIDRLGAYNATHGFKSGDAALRAFADNLQASFPDATLARFADDHFVLLVEAKGLEERLLPACLALENWQGGPLRAKAGFALVSDGDNLRATSYQARTACNSIKNRLDVFLCAYEPAMDRDLVLAERIRASSSRALVEGWIEVWYQPVLRTLTGRLCSVEALARWRDPKYGLLPPGLFVGVLEQAHLTHAFSLHVLREACRGYFQLKEALGAPVSISVNLSRLDFEQDDIAGEAFEIVQQMGVPLDMIHFEITESCLSDNPELQAKIAGLRKHGFEVWMDDFGSAYSSLNTLQNFEFDTLKLDMKFLRSLDSNPKTKVIIGSVVDMARQLGIRTLAEGVETREHLDFLRQVGCERAQGYLFSKPLPAAELAEVLKRKGIVPETRDDTVYADALHRVDLFSAAPFETLANAREEQDIDGAHALAIIERENGHFRVLASNGMGMKATGYFRLHSPKVFLRYATAEPGSRARFLRLLSQADESGASEVLVFSIRGQLLRVQVARITATGQRSAYLIMLSNPMRPADQTRRLQTEHALRHLCYTYRRIDVISRKRDTAENLFLSAGKHGTDMRPDNFEGFVRTFAASRIPEEQRKAYITFMREATSELDGCNEECAMSACFPTKTSIGFIPLVYDIIPFQVAGETFFLSAMRDGRPLQLHQAASARVREANQ